VEPAAHLPDAPILAISGSLRRDSINSAALRAVVTAAARDGMSVTIDDSARALPHFDPDLDPFLPEPVRRFRQACAEASGVLLAVPEYTFGIPGAFKNALDWLVGSCSDELERVVELPLRRVEPRLLARLQPPVARLDLVQLLEHLVLCAEHHPVRGGRPVASLYHKPVALLHVASPERGAHVREPLAHVLRAHNADVTLHRLPIARRDRDATGEITNQRIVGELRTVVADLSRRSTTSRAA
jgi:NAD(P)H-dependent FMN reductase